MKLPVPLCKSSGAGPPRCPSFYNNFEVVDLQAFRTAEQWAFFLLAERSHAFLCEAFPGRTRPGRCGGGGMGDAIFRTLQVNTFDADRGFGIARHRFVSPPGAHRQVLRA